MFVTLRVSLERHGNHELSDRPMRELSMRSHTCQPPTLASVALAFAMTAIPCAVTAQEHAAQEEIIVKATSLGRSATGAETRTVSTKRLVSYAGLSLTTPSGVQVFKTRIRDAATSGCSELDQKYQIAAEGDTTQKCIDDAVASAMADAQKAIDAAEQRGPAYVAPPPGIQTREGITVEAARGDRGEKTQVVTAKRVVSYTDISLATASGEKVLDTRIRDAAYSACTELEQKYPVAAEGDTKRKCIDKAIEGAMPDMRKAIDAAKRASR
jgi:UrcA family protein